MEEQNKTQKKDSLNIVTDNITPTVNFIKQNFKDLALKMLKINLVNYLAIALIILLFGALAVGIVSLFGLGINNFNIQRAVSIPILVGALVIIGTVGILILSWISAAISSVSLVVTKEQYDKTYSGIIPIFNRIKIKILKYLLASFGISVLVFAIPMLIVIGITVFSNMALLAIPMILLLIIYYFVAMIVYAFVTQFWLWEILIGGKTTREGLKASIRLAKRNILAVFIYDILIVVAGGAIVLPFAIVDIVLRVLMNVGVAVTVNLAVIITSYLGYIVFKLILTLIQTVLVNTIILPYKYTVWSKLREK